MDRDQEGLALAVFEFSRAPSLRVINFQKELYDGLN